LSGNAASLRGRTRAAVQNPAATVVDVATFGTEVGAAQELTTTQVLDAVTAARLWSRTGSATQDIFAAIRNLATVGAQALTAGRRTRKFAATIGSAATAAKQTVRTRSTVENATAAVRHSTTFGSERLTTAKNTNAGITGQFQTIELIVTNDGTSARYEHQRDATACQET
jgi:hypothetical protein